jgi:MurNAc alpha-1-phosphate uridylyltransferase
MSDAVMIFAAGFGTRMGVLTRNTPKPLLKVGGKALIDHALDRVAEADVERVVINTHYLAEQMAQHLSDRDVLISHETPHILDSGGGLKAALPLLRTDQPFTLNPDVLWLGPNPLILLKQAWDPACMDALMLCVPLERTHGRAGGGDFRIESSGQIMRGGDLVYGGAQIIKTERIADDPNTVFSLNKIWDEMNVEGRLHLVTYPGIWCDIGRPEGLVLAENLLGENHV